MLEKIKEALRKQGLPEDIAGLINVTEENQIEGAINNLKQSVDTLLQREGDKRATEATKTATKNLKEKLGFTENDDPDTIKQKFQQTQQTQPPGGSPGGQPTSGQQTTQGGGQTQPTYPNDEVNTLKKQLDEIQKKLDEKESKEQASARKEIFIQKAKEKNIPESTAKAFAQHVDFQNLDTDDKIDAQVTETEKTLQTYKTESIENSVEGGGTPGSPSEPENVEEHVAERAKQRYSNEAEAEGKEV